MEDMWDFSGIAEMLGGQPPEFDNGESFPTPEASQPEEKPGPYPPMEGPLQPQFTPDGELEKVTLSPSAGYGMGPGNQATGQNVFGEDKPQNERFGDANKWLMGPSSEDPNNYIPIPYAVEGARPMRPMMEAIAGSQNIGGNLDRYGANLGPMLGSALNEMGRWDSILRGDKGGYGDEYQRNYERGWIDNATNNNLLTVRPEPQADGSINRVYTYESGRQASEQYQAAPPPRSRYTGPFDPKPPDPPPGVYDPMTGEGMRLGNAKDFLGLPMPDYQYSVGVPDRGRPVEGMKTVNSGGDMVLANGTGIKVQSGDQVHQYENVIIIDRGNTRIFIDPVTHRQLAVQNMSGGLSQPSVTNTAPVTSSSPITNTTTMTNTAPSTVTKPFMSDADRWEYRGLDYRGNPQYYDKATGRFVGESAVPLAFRNQPPWNAQ